MATCLDTAIQLCERGLPITLCKDKIPIGRNWQNRKYNTRLVEIKFGQNPLLNVGLVLGPQSGTIDLECDGEEAESDLADLFKDTTPPVTPTFQSKRGKHRFFKFSPELEPLGKAVVHYRTAEVRIGCDGKGAQTLLPPSITDDFRREWLINFDDAPIAPLPDVVVKRLLECESSERNGSGDFDVTAIINGVSEGQRTNAAASYIGSLLANCKKLDAASLQVMWESILAWNERNKPPLDVDALRRVFESIGQRESRARKKRNRQRRRFNSPGERYAMLRIDIEKNRTEVVNGMRLAKSHGENFRWVNAWKKFLVWDGKRWAFDNRLQVETWAKKIQESMWLEMAECVKDSGDKEVDAIAAFIKATGKVNGIRAMIELARSEPNIAMTPQDFDKDGWLINLDNGTFDLRTNTLQPHNKSDYLTKLSPVSFDENAKCPTWESFIDRIMDGDQDLIKFLQRAAGLSITHDVSDHVLFFCYGTGANGKSTFLNTIQKLLGPDYAMKAPPELLMAKRSETHPTERADLSGKRFVSCIETESGRRFAESLVKELTGGDNVRARRMREDFWEFPPTHKIWLAANHKPVVRGTDDGIWRRVKLIPFNVSIPENQQDKQLPAKLLEELPGILNWALAGLHDWREHGLAVPDAVKDATDGYRSEMDIVGTFIGECCYTDDPEATTRATDLFERFKDWSDSKMSQREFGKQMTEKGFERKRNNGVRYVGIQLPLKINVSSEK